MKHITKVSMMKAQSTVVCDATDPESIIDGIQADALACVGALLLQALEGDKQK